MSKSLRPLRKVAAICAYSQEDAIVLLALLVALLLPQMVVAQTETFRDALERYAKRFPPPRRVATRDARSTWRQRTRLVASRDTKPHVALSRRRTAGASGLQQARITASQARAG